MFYFYFDVVEGKSSRIRPDGRIRLLMTALEHGGYRQVHQIICRRAQRWRLVSRNGLVLSSARHLFLFLRCFCCCFGLSPTPLLNIALLVILNCISTSAVLLPVLGIERSSANVRSFFPLLPRRSIDNLGVFFCRLHRVDSIGRCDLSWKLGV